MCWPAAGHDHQQESWRVMVVDVDKKYLEINLSSVIHYVLEHLLLSNVTSLRPDAVIGCVCYSFLSLKFHTRS